MICWIPMINTLNLNIEKRDYQERIFNKALKYISEFLKKKAAGELKPDAAATLLIESPTGSGKTVVGQAILKALSIGMVNNTIYEPLWIAHRRELLRQANKTNEDVFKIQGFETMSMFDRNPDRFRGQKKVLLVDEAQHDPAASSASIHSAIQPEIIIGLTATPYRVDRAKLCFEKVIKDAGIHQLIREGWLAPFQQYMMEGDWTPANVTRVFMQQPEEWGLSVSYFLRVEEAIEMADRLKAEGIKAESITGDSDREDILEAFHAGEIQHLSNCMVLTEGFDAPKLKTAFVRASSKGPTIQMAGRAFRKHISTPYVNVVQNEFTKFPFTRHATAEMQYVEENGIWKHIGNKDIEPIIQKNRFKRVQVKIELPEYLIKKKAKSRKNPFGNSWL